MAGTTEGGKKAAKTNKKRYGKAFYSKIGREGGKRHNPNSGFGSRQIDENGLDGPARASFYGRMGGSKNKGRSKKFAENRKRYDKPMKYEKLPSEKEMT